MGVDKILSMVLNDISLNSKGLLEIRKKANDVVSFFRKSGFDAKIGGSLAKNTLVKKENQDVDIFVVLKNGDISKIESVVKKKFYEVNLVHGSRDYLRIKEGNILFEIIPIIKFKKPEEAKNITDFSLIHVGYVTKILKKKPKLADEIKLAKAFCVAQKCYGAESYIGGFSGYALEVLVCYYGGFVNFLKKIKKDRVIDPLKSFKNKDEIMRELNESKLVSPIILIDPTYKYRNVCAGLTKEVLDLFLESSDKFLKRPSADFFRKKEFSESGFLDFAKKGKFSVYKINFSTNRQEGDIAGTKMKKLFRFLIRELEKKEQEVVSYDFIYSEGQEALGYLTVKEKNIIEIKGPSVKMKEAVVKFKKVRKNIVISGGFAFAKEKVEIPVLFRNSSPVAESMMVGFEFEKLV
jgi:tRNA nucleotidyltransferase (CCA-adding enzyme)